MRCSKERLPWKWGRQVLFSFNVENSLPSTILIRREGEMCFEDFAMRVGGVVSVYVKTR